MSDELIKRPETIDGFDVDDDGAPQGRRVIQGVRLRFTNDFTWINDDEEELAPELELIVIDRLRVLQKWLDQMPVESRFLEPGEQWPDIKALNDAAPRSEWREGPDGKPQGPWQCQWVIYLLEPQSLDRFTWPTNTTGGHIAVGDLSDRIKTMRRLRGEHVYPVVVLRDRYMPTRWGGRQRPHLEIRRWVMLGPDSKMLPAPGEGETAAAQLEHFAADKPAEKAPEAPPANVQKPDVQKPAKPWLTTTAKRGVTHVDAPATTPVEEPNSEEVFGDEINF